MPQEFAAAAGTGRRTTVDPSNTEPKGGPKGLLRSMPEMLYAVLLSPMGG